MPYSNLTCTFPIDSLIVESDGITLLKVLYISNILLLFIVFIFLTLIRKLLFDSVKLLNKIKLSVKDDQKHEDTVDDSEGNRRLAGRRTSSIIKSIRPYELDVPFSRAKRVEDEGEDVVEGRSPFNIYYDTTVRAAE
jgi:hypothetical protein